MTIDAAVALALGAAALFAVGNQCSRIALRFTDSRTATLYQIGIGAAMYWLAAPLYVESWYWVSAALPWFIVTGLFRPVLSANLGMAGTRILGPTISSTVAASAPIFGVAFGVLLLSESLSLAGMAGTVLIVLGVVILSSGGAAARSWPFWALGFPVGAALIRSLTHTFSKFGLETLPDPYFVALIAYSVSLPIALGEARLRGVGANAVKSGGLPWLAATGLVYGISVMVLNMALLRGELVVVSPIVACSPLFTMLLGLMVFREHTITPRVVAAVAMVVPGVVLVSARF